MRNLLLLSVDGGAGAMGLGGLQRLGPPRGARPGHRFASDPSWLNPAFQQACARQLIRNSTDALVLQMPYSEIRV